MVNLKTTVKDIGFTHEDFAALLDKYDYHFSPGDVVAGTVIAVASPHVQLHREKVSKN